MVCKTQGALSVDPQELAQDSNTLSQMFQIIGTEIYVKMIKID
jgi:hypothetical protein